MAITRSENPSLRLVIPCYNEEAALPHLLASLETIQKKANIPIRVLLVDDGDKQGARKEFLAAADEAAKFPFAEGRNEMLVRSHNALGIIGWQEGNFSEALRWLKLADQEQIRTGGNWVPDLTANRKRLEGIINAPAAP